MNLSFKHNLLKLYKTVCCWCVLANSQSHHDYGDESDDDEGILLFAFYIWRLYYSTMKLLSTYYTACVRLWFLFFHCHIIYCRRVLSTALYIRLKLIGRDLILVWHVAHIQAYYHGINDTFSINLFIIFNVAVGIDCMLADTFNVAWWKRVGVLVVVTMKRKGKKAGVGGNRKKDNVLLLLGIKCDTGAKDYACVYTFCLAKFNRCHFIAYVAAVNSNNYNYQTGKNGERYLQDSQVGKYKLSCLVRLRHKKLCMMTQNKMHNLLLSLTSRSGDGRLSQNFASKQ